MTGAPIPDGADVVIKYEEVTRVGDQIEVYRPLKKGSNIVPTGEDVKKDELIARRGTIITPPLLGLIASLGINQVPVFSKVKVALLSTGNELLEPSEEMRPGKIYNSNLYTLQAHCLQLGVEPIPLGIVEDDQEAIAQQILKGLQDADIVISTGGVSVGDYDLVQDALLSLDAEMLYWKVAIKPGSAMIAAMKDQKLVIGLSGNPASSLIAFDLIVSPLLRKMLGMERYLPAVTQAVLSEGFGKASPQRRFLRGSLHKQNGIDYIKLTGVQANGVLKSMIGCNVLVDVPAGCEKLVAGEQVSAYIIGRIDGND
jgi:molybdopterin molybdotransferase